MEIVIVSVLSIKKGGENNIITKIKGLRSKVEQVTFVGKEHPTCGTVRTFSWEELKAVVERRNPTIKVISFKVTPSGLYCYHEDTRFGSQVVKL